MISSAPYSQVNVIEVLHSSAYPLSCREIRDAISDFCGVDRDYMSIPKVNRTLNKLLHQRYVERTIIGGIARWRCRY